MTKDLKILTTYWFLAGLAFLLFNDFVLKGLYGNWLTGKLSDFAGLFIFPLFWTALLPKHKNKIFWLTGLIFIFWKSSYSQILIDTWNNLGLLTISRVVDFSDYIALVVLPLSYYAYNHKNKIKRLSIRPVIPLVVAAFSFTATSYSTNIEVGKEYPFDFPKDTLKKRIYYLPSVQNTYREDYRLDSSGQFRVHKYNWDTIPAKGAPIDKFVHDTMNLFVYEDFCFEGYTARIILSGDTHKSKITLSAFHHVCPKDGKFILPVKKRDDMKFLSKSFEKKVLEQLRKK